MNKLVLLTLSTFAIAAPVFGELGDDRAQMEAKYGKEIHPSNVFNEADCYPTSVKVNGDVIRKPANYCSSYEDKAHDYQIDVQYNSRGIVTEISYQHEKGGGIDDKQFHSLLERNGFSIGWSLDDYQDWHGVTLEPLYPIIGTDEDCYLKVLWSTANGEDDDFEYPEPKHTVVTEIKIIRAEALADTAQNVRNWRLFEAAVRANPNVAEEVGKKIREALKKAVR